MKKIYKEIYGRVQGFMANPFHRFLILSTYTGSGKSLTTLQTLKEWGYTWIYLAPYHHNIYENLELSPLHKYNYIHLQSRSFLCEIEDYKKIAKKGINIRPICETSCPLRETTCPYYERKRLLFEEPQNWAGVHHHIPEFLPEFLLRWKESIRMHNYYEVLVIDENPISVFFENETATPEKIADLIDIIERANLTHKDTHKVVEFLRYLINEFYIKRDLDYEAILEYFRSINFTEFYEAYQIGLIESITEGNIEIREVPKDYLNLFSYMELKASIETLPYMIIKKKDYEFKNKRYYFTVFKDSPLIDCPLKIIGLDGTANIDIWSSIVGKTPSVLDRRYKYKNMFILDNPEEPRYPYTSWIRYGQITSTGKRLCGLIDEIAKTKQNNLLIATTLPLKKYIKKNITAKNVTYCHFYYLRSRNDLYQKADSIVIICEPNIPPFKLEAFTKLSNWDENVWRQVFTHDEIAQAAGRIREDEEFGIGGRKREKREVFVFPNTKYPNGEELFPEAKKISEFDLKFYLKYDKTWKEFIEENIPYNHRIARYKLAEKLSQTQNLVGISKNAFYGKRKHKKYLDELIEEGRIIDEGRKGLRRS